MAFLIAVIVALIATPLAAVLARRTGVVDHPGPLKTHAQPVPYLGGVALFAAIAVGVIATGRYELFVPLGLALLLGVADDVTPLPVGLRLGLEVVIGIVAGAVAPGDPLMRIATAGSVIALVNAVNLLDGQDGLAGSVGLVAALGFACLGHGVTPYALALAGGLAGFLFFNRPPARIYLGDGGAYLLGTALALAAGLAGGGALGWSVWFAAPLLVALPLVDTGVAMWRRLRQHRPLFAGDRSHVYDQLVDRGMSVTASTLTCGGAQALFSVVGVVAARLAPSSALTITVVVAILAAIAVRRAGFVSA